MLRRHQIASVVEVRQRYHALIGPHKGSLHQSALSVAERSIEDKTWREQLQQPATIELIRLFYAISNPEIRRKFLEMAKSMAEGGARSRAAGPMRPS
jgi:hypothetical protein